VIDQLGTIQQRSLVIEQHMNASVSDVWEAIVQPNGLAAWLAPAEVDLRVGGKIVLRFENSDHVMKGEIRELQPPEAIEYSWAGGERGSVVRFELAPEGDGTLLTLTHTLLEDGELAGFGAGWHHHLELLAAHVSIKRRGMGLEPLRDAQGRVSAAGGRRALGPYTQARWQPERS